MALIPGQDLISNSENDKKRSRRNFSYDPFVGATTKATEGNFFSGLRDLVTNTAFNVVDSAAFGVIGNKLEQNVETEKGGFFERSKRTYGDTWDALGIKPYEELSSAGKFGLGLGQAAGFFIPYSGISKVTRFAQKAAFSNANKMIGEAVETAIKGSPSSNPLRSVIKNAVSKHSDTVPSIYKATPEQSANFSKMLSGNIRKEAADFVQSTGSKVNQTQIDQVADGVIKALEDIGNQGKYIDDLGELIGSLGTKFGDTRISRNLAGYVGRAVDQSINMALYEGIGHIARASAGAEYEDIDYNVLDSMKHSAGFAAAISLADFIPGGKRAGSVKDFYRFARANLSKSRNWSQLYKDGKISDNQLRVLSSWFSKQGKVAPTSASGGILSVRDLEAGKASGAKLAQWLDDAYSTNKSELLRAIMRDGGKSLVASLPRAAVDGVVTATYLNGTENFMNAIHDESMIADYLVGAFMAMRAYQPLDARSPQRYRYDNSIDARFNFMESIGMDIGAISQNVKAMDMVMHDIQLSAKNLETMSNADQIYESIFKEREAPAGDTGEATGSLKERALADKVVKKFIPLYMNRNNIVDINSIQNDYDKGVIPNVNSMSDSQFADLWSDIKAIETSTGRTLDQYTELGYDRFREDFEAPIAKNHSDMLARYSAQAADILGLTQANDLAEGGMLSIRDFGDYSNDPHIDFFLRQLSDLEQMGVVDRDRSGRKPVSILDVASNQAAKDQIKQLADEYMSESSEYFDSARTYSMHDNPAVDYIQEYSNVVRRNKIEDALLGKIREDDANFDSIRRVIEDTLGDTVSSKGIQITADDTADPVRVRQVERFVNELAELKRSAGKTNTSNVSKKIDFDKANDLYKSLEKSNITHYSENTDQFYIGGKSMSDFRSDVYETQMARSGLDRSDWVVFTMLKDQFGERDGKVQMPSRQLLEQSLRTQMSDALGTTPADGVTKSQQAEIDKTVSKYSEALERMGRTNLVNTVDNTKGFKDEEIDIGQVANIIQTLYDADAKAQFSDFGKLLSDRADKANQLIKDFTKLSTDIENFGPVESIEQARQVVDKNAEALSAMKDFLRTDSQKQAIEKALEMARSAEEIVNEKDFLSNLFSRDMITEFSNIYDLSRQISNLANIDSAQDGYSAAMALMRSRISEGLRGNVDGIESKPIHEAFYDFMSDRGGGYKEAKALIDEVQRRMVRDYNLDQNKLIGDIATNEIVDMFRMKSSAEHRGNAQSFITRLQKLGLNRFLNRDNRALSDNIEGMLMDADNIESNVFSIVSTIKESMLDGEFSRHEQKINQEIISTIGTLNRRKSIYPTYKIHGESFQFDKGEGTVVTPLGEFSNNASYFAPIVKSTYIDVNGNVKNVTDLTLDKAQELFDKAHQKVKEKGIVGELADERSLSGFFGRSKNTEGIPHPLFVPLQANENVGVMFPRTDDNIKKLKDDFSTFAKLRMDEAKAMGKSQAFAFHLDAINRNLSDNNSDGISAAIRSMYYHNNISRDMFWQMVGEGNNKGEVYESSRKAQIKQFKYIHHVNSEQAMSFDGRTINMITSALKVFDEKSIDTKAIKHLNKRAKDGVNIFVYNDEVEGKQGLTAYDIIGATVDERLDQMNIVANRQEMRDRLIERTARDYGMDTDAESLQQSIVDGVTFASEDAMRADALLMSSSFDEGVTAAKMQFHSAEKSFIGKTAVRYEPSLSKFMKDNGIDYIMPASSAKSWEGKQNVVQADNWSPRESVGDNISRQFGGKVEGISFKNFDADAVKYLYATHGGNTRSNTNTSAMHFINSEGIKAYNSQLRIDQIVGTINRVASNAQKNYYAGGLEGFFRGKYEDADSYFSHYAATEQLMDWNVDSQNSLVRDSVMRMLKDSLYNSLLVQKRSDIVNTFLFTDSRLKSAIYDGDSSQGFVKSFGEVRIPENKRSEQADANTSLVFSMNRDNDFQDFILNASDGVRIETPNRSMDKTFAKTNEKAFETLWKEVINEGTYGSAHDKLQEINMALSGQTLKEGKAVVYQLDVDKKGNIKGQVVDEALTNAVNVLREAGVTDLSIAVNSHKIPKKFASDSIVNRLEGFVDAEKGNIIEANNYEVALQHQADQDGDKLVTYMKMPFDVLDSSMHNMALAKDAPTVAPDQTRFPNVFGSMTNDRTFAQPGELAASRENDPLRYMQTERNSKYVVGTTVKVQGSATLMNLANIQFNGNQIMRFGNTADGDFTTASDFARITGSITQSILDAWGGVHDSLLKQKQIKDFILFGDRGNIPIEAINKTSVADEGFNGIFNIKEPDNTPKGKVFRDYVREVYNAFEGVYTVFGDTYEGGVATKPEFHHLASTYYKLKGIFNKNDHYIFSRLLSKYNRVGRTDDANVLRNLFENKDQIEGTRSLRDVFSFGTNFESLVETHPQLKALDAVVKSGDITRDPDLTIYESPYVKELFSYRNDQPTARMASLKGDKVLSESLLINDEAVNRMISYYDSDKFGDTQYNAPKRLGLFNHTINNKINQLEYSKNFYRKVGDEERVLDINEEIRELRVKQQDVQHQIYKKLHPEYVNTGNFIDTQDGFSNNFDNTVHAYRIRKNQNGKEYFEFYRALKPGEKTPSYIKGKFVVLTNPIEVQSVNKKQSIEGMAMEMATSDYYTNIEQYGVSRTRTDKIIGEFRRDIEIAKAELREVNSDTFNLTREVPGMRSEIYEDQSGYAHIVIDKMLNNIKAKAKNYNVDVVDILKMALSPRALPNSIVRDGGEFVNNFKIDKKFTQALTKHIIDNKHHKTSEEFMALEKVMRSFADNMVVSNGLVRTSMHSVDNANISKRRNEYRSIAQNKGYSLLESLTRMAEDDILLRESIKRFNTTKVELNRDNTISQTANTIRKNNDSDKGCNII